MDTYYTSSRNNLCRSTFSNAVLKGIADQGGLFVPLDLKRNSLSINNLIDQSYHDIAYSVLSCFTDDFSKEELQYCISCAYTQTFSTNEIVKLSSLDNLTLLELYHGPTSAFKDVALQLLPSFMQVAMHKKYLKEKYFILTATSGDTGKAALEGFKNHDDIQILCLYPNHLVSTIQEKQMLTTHGNNTTVVAVDGNFDDCQRMVKEVFNDAVFNQELSQKGIQLSSANSINIGRLCPQVVYYFSTYCKLVANKTIQCGEKVNFVVPTGNFGNILAGYYAKLLGLPLHKLICASNSNNVLTEFVNTGIYNKQREFHKTISPSMDILISSNVERYLFECMDHNSSRVNECMRQLANNGKYQLSDAELSIMQKDFIAYCCDDETTQSTIKKTYVDHHRIVDTHTAVAINCYDQYIKTTHDTTHTIILSTASCYKFPLDVLNSFSDTNTQDEFEAIHRIHSLCTEPLPDNIQSLETLEIQNKIIIQQDELRSIILERVE